MPWYLKPFQVTLFALGEFITHPDGRIRDLHEGVKDIYFRDRHIISKMPWRVRGRGRHISASAHTQKHIHTNTPTSKNHFVFCLLKLRSSHGS